MKTSKGRVEQADGVGTKNRGRLKKIKKRLERHRAKDDPECPSGYKKYNGYET
jgi:hypothetical protein